MVWNNVYLTHNNNCKPMLTDGELTYPIDKIAKTIFRIRIRRCVSKKLPRRPSKKGNCCYETTPYPSVRIVLAIWTEEGDVDSSLNLHFVDGESWWRNCQLYSFVSHWNSRLILAWSWFFVEVCPAIGYEEAPAGLWLLHCLNSCHLG